jgi:outer membrane lipoprotein-sorting protein
MIQETGTRGRRFAAAFAVAVVTMAGTAAAQKKATPGDGTPFTITRASLANTASFKVTQTLAPKEGQPLTREYRVEVKGNKARLDYEDQAIGPVRYVANEKGVYFYIPANKNAMKQTFKGGVEGALKVAFAQVADQMEGAREIGRETVAGQPTIIYKAPKTGALIYLGTRPGFRLPVKTILSNEGGTSTLTVSDIKLNVALADSRFALPAGTQILDSGSAPSAAAPGLPSGGGR